MMKKIVSIISILIFGSILFAQNTMFIPDVSGNAADTISVSLHIDNIDDFVAFQTDIQLPNEIEYIVNSAVLTGRAQDHILSVLLLENNLLRVFVYSLSNSTFLGNSGSVLDFQVILGPIPGNFPLELINPIIGDVNSQNILTGFTNGNLYIYAPDINLDVDSLDFGEVPLTSYEERIVIVSNPGNLPLDIIRIYTDNPYFEVIGDTTFIISAGNSTSVFIRFNSIEKGNYQNQLFFLSNDPDETLISIPMYAIAFAVNELHVMDAVGRSGNPVDVSFTVNNMEEFVAFQFDIILPDVLSYIDSSVVLSARKVDHVVSANTIQDGVLRIIAYSPSNTAFTGIDGEIVSFAALVNGIGGNYPLNLTNVILSDQDGNNILSEFYSGTLSITAPDIEAVNSLDMGEIPVTDTLLADFVVANIGSDTLHISSFESGSDFFWCNTSIPQTLSPQQAMTFQLSFYCAAKGTYSTQFTMLSNDPDENPFILDVCAEAFAPNYISVSDIYAGISDTVTMEINVDNYEEFVALQVDIIVPSGFDYVQNSASLTNRANGHILQVNEISLNTIRIISFSMDQLPFWGNTGTVVELDFVTNLSSGNYPLILENGVLANSNSENILKDMTNGTLCVDQDIIVIEVLPCPGGFITIIESDSINFCFTGYDPDGNPLEYSWKLDDVEVSTDSTYLFTTDFTSAGDYLVTLNVTDNMGVAENTLNYSWNVIVDNLNRAPVADAGIDQTVLEFETVQLDGSGSYDPDSDPLTYLWTAPAGIILSDPTLVNPTFTAPEVPTNASVSYEFILEVDDGISADLRVSSEPDIVVITVENINQAPVADAGIDQTVLEFETVQLDGSGSYDPDSDPLTYLWTAPAGIILSDPTLVNPTFTAPEVPTNASVSYELILEVDDGISADLRVSSDPDIVIITVNNINQAPTIVLPDDFTFAEDGTLIEDFAPYVFDIDGDPLTLTVSGNTEITVSITDLIVTFGATPDWNGTELLTFTVDDNQTRDTASDDVDVIVTPVNDPPEIVLPDDFTFIEDGSLIEDFTPYIFDIDGDDLTLSVTGNDSITVDIADVIVTFSAEANWFGTELLTFTVDDNVTRATASDSVEVIVTPVNDPPVLIGFSPEEPEFTVGQDSIVTFFVDVVDIDSELSYRWFVNEELQTEISDTFVYQFAELGEFEIKSEVSDEDYDIITIWDVTVIQVGAEHLIPTVTKLSYNYPNPFNPETTIDYSLKEPGNISLEIYNIRGQKVNTLINEFKDVGYHSVIWNGRDSNDNQVSSGIYFYKLNVNGKTEAVKKCLLLK